MVDMPLLRKAAVMVAIPSRRKVAVILLPRKAAGTADITRLRVAGMLLPRRVAMPLPLKVKLAGEVRLLHRAATHPRLKVVAMRLLRRAAMLLPRRVATRLRPSKVAMRLLHRVGTPRLPVGIHLPPRVATERRPHLPPLPSTWGP